MIVPLSEQRTYAMGAGVSTPKVELSENSLEGVNVVTYVMGRFGATKNARRGLRRTWNWFCCFPVPCFTYAYSLLLDTYTYAQLYLRFIALRP